MTTIWRATMANGTMGRPRVRPRLTDPGVIDLLCERLICGQSMVDACTPIDVPTDQVVYAVMAQDPDFRAVIARAREAQQHAIIDQTVDMADKATIEDWQVVRLRIWARQWRAGKLSPKIYGERVQNEITGTLTLEQLVAASMLAKQET